MKLRARYAISNITAHGGARQGRLKLWDGRKLLLSLGVGPGGVSGWYPEHGDPIYLDRAPRFTATKGVTVSVGIKIDIVADYTDDHNRRRI